MADTKYIRASDGTGNAEVATVQTTRAPLSTTLIVDTVEGMPTKIMGSMGTPHTFVDPVSSETITVISEATAVDFSGHIDGSNIEIDAIAPGYTDLGSEVGDIIIIRPTTQWADNVADVVEVSLNDDGTLKDDAVTAGTIADNAIDAEALFTDSVDPVKRATETIFDFVASGVVLAGTGYGSTLAWSLSAGVVYINGKRLTYAGDTGTVTATKDTYFDLLDNDDGTAVLVNTAGNIVTVNAASPALASNSIRVGIIQSGANIASVAAINQGQPDKLLPIASSVPYTTTDSLGNLICPRDPQRKTLGYTRLAPGGASTTDTSGTPQDITGYSLTFIADGLKKVKVKCYAPYMSSSSASLTNRVLYIREGSTTLGTSETQGTSAASARGQQTTEFVAIPTAGTHTYKISFSQNQAGTLSLTSTTGEFSFLIVEAA